MYFNSRPLQTGLVLTPVAGPSTHIENIPPRPPVTDFQSFAYSFDLHLLSLSTGKSHPLASCSTIQLCAVRWVLARPNAAVEIIGDYIIVLLPDAWAIPGDGNDDELYIVNWKTGSNTLVCLFSCRLMCYELIPNYRQQLSCRAHTKTWSYFRRTLSSSPMCRRPGWIYTSFALTVKAFLPFSPLVTYRY